MYDLKELNSTDFEILVRDILSKKYKDIHIERFGVGRDGGIDLRFRTKSNEIVIVQCKHYANSKINNLKSTLRKDELQKVKGLELDKYMLVSSLNLTPNLKSELIEIMSPFIKESEDIWGLDEINDLIKDYKDIELRHYKLWFKSTNIMNSIIHSEIYSRNTFLLQSIKDKVEYFVEPDSFNKAYENLNSKNYCIITGKPGSGKTTLAEMMLLRYIKEGYEIIEVDNLSEIFKVWKKDSKQIFYFDDFLGRINLLSNYEYSESDRLDKFINYITKKDSSTKLIVTTREYILNDAIENNYYSTRYIQDEFIVKINKFSEKFNILLLNKYLLNSNINYKRDLDRYKVYEIVKHKNFSPRILDYIIGSYNKDKNLYKYFKDMLDNPYMIWNEIFDNLDMNIKVLLYLFIINDRGFNADELFCKYDRINKLFADYYNYKIVDYAKNKLLKILVPTFLKHRIYENLKPESYNSTEVIKLVNPGLQDFIKQMINEKFREKDYLIFLECLTEYNEIINVMTNTNMLKFIDFNEILDKLYNLFKFQSSHEYTYNFYNLANLLKSLSERKYFNIKKENISTILNNILEYIVDKVEDITHLIEIIYRIKIMCNIEFSVNNINTLWNIYGINIKNMEDLDYMSSYCILSKIDNNKCMIELENKIKNEILSIEDMGIYMFNGASVYTYPKCINNILIIGDYFKINMDRTIEDIEDAYQEYRSILEEARGLQGLEVLIDDSNYLNNYYSLDDEIDKLGFK